MKALAQAHIEELDEKLKELLAMKATLEHLVHSCHGDDRPDCPIIETLSDETVVASRGRSTGHAHKAGLRSGRY